MFLPLVSLENLILEDCGVKIIPGKAFAPLVALKHLSLNGNPLDTFKPMAFWNESDETPRVVPLEDLSLKGTQLKELPVEMMKNLTQLRNLDLSNTSIETVGNASFSKLHDLVKLTVDSCRSLKQIETGAFTGLNKLQNLVITNNKVLGEIGWGAFKNLSSLKVLDLSGNNVEIFGASMADWEDIGLADLRFNPIRCDCHTRWILQLLDDPQNVTFSPRGGPASLTSGDDPAAAPGVRYTTSTTTITTSSLTRQINCTAPPSLQGKPLTSLSADDFRCPTSPVDRRRRNRNANEKRYKVGIIAASVTCFFLVSFALFVKFRKRIFSACRGQYRYKAYHSNGIKGGSPSAEIMVLEDTQFEDLDSDAEVTKVRV
nr:hypothetical protein BaRGS_019494 [Batillaria attramentaria]